MAKNYVAPLVIVMSVFFATLWEFGLKRNYNEHHMCYNNKKMAVNTGKNFWNLKKPLSNNVTSQR